MAEIVNQTVRLRINTDEAKEAIRIGLINGLEAAGIFVESRAKLYCPVDTGLLRNSIAHALSGDQPSIGATDGKRHQRSYKSESTDKHGNPVKVTKGKYAGKMPKAKDYDDLYMYVGTNVEYAPYVEMGHINWKTGKHIPAQPYLQPAFVNHVDDIKSIIESYIQKAIRDFNNNNSGGNN